MASKRTQLVDDEPDRARFLKAPDTVRPVKTILSNRLLASMAVLASVGGALFGYDTGVVSGAMLLISAHKDECPRYGGFGLSHFEQEVVVDATIGGAIVGTAVSGLLCDRFGRRPVIMFGSALFTAGSVLLGLAPSLVGLVVGRVVVGLAIGFASHTTPVYLAEVAPPEVRGVLVGMFNAFIVLGQVLAGVVDGAFFYVDHGWRWMLGIAAVLSVAQFVGFLFLPESPRWLMKKARGDEAEVVLRRVLAQDDVSQEVEEIHQSLALSSQSMGWGEILRSQALRRALLLACGAMLLQQMVGINTVMYYSATILKDAGVGASGGDMCCCSKDAIPIWLSAATATGQLVGCLFSLVYADRIGRRKLILGSLTGVIGMLGLLGAAFVAFSSTVSHVLALVGLIGYLVFFGAGMSPVPWILNSEIFPLQARSRCASAAVSLNWGANFLVAGTFLTLSDALGRGETFWLFGGVGVLGWVWLFTSMPETLGRSLEEMAELFEGKGNAVHASRRVAAVLPNINDP